MTGKPAEADLQARIQALEEELTKARQKEEERARNQEAIERLAAEQAVLARIGRVVDSTPDIRQVYERFATITRGRIPFDTLSVNVVDASRERFSVAYLYGIEIPGLTDMTEIPLAGSMTDYVLRRREAMILKATTIEEVPLFYPEITRISSLRAGFRSNMLIPLFASDKGIGVLHFRTRREGTYTETDLQLAVRIGRQIAGAIANTRLYADLQQQRRAAERLAKEQATIAEIGRIIGTTLNIDEVYERFAAETRKLIPFDRLVVNLNLPETAERHVAYVSGTEVPVRRQGAVVPLSQSTNEELIHTRKGLILSPRRAEEIAARYGSLVHTFQAGIRSFLSVPLISNDVVIGALHFRAKAPDLYGDEDLRLAERISSQIAGAIANAQLFARLQESRQAIQRLAEEQTAVAEIGRVIGSSLHIDEVYRRFAAEVGTLVPYDRLMITLCRKADNWGKIDFVSGMVIPGRAVGDTFPVAGSISGTVTQTCTGLVITEANMAQLVNQFSILPEMTKLGIRSLMSVPLLFKHEVIGVCNLQSVRPNAFTEEDFRLMEKISAQISGSIVNAQLYDELQRAERSLRESEESYAVLLKTVPDGVVRTDMEGRIVYVNDVALQVGGFSGPVAVAGRSFLDFFSPEDQARAREHLLQCRNGKLAKQEYTLLAQGQTPLFFEVNTATLLDKQGLPYGIVHVCRDITDRKRLEQALRQHLENLESLVKERTVELEEINTALRVMIRKREEDQKKFGENMQANISQLVVPFLDKLRASEQTNRQSLSYLNILETNLLNITSPFIRQLAADYRQLTPKELQIAELIRQGKSSKEIADLFTLSVGTVVSHRNNIRKKLHLRFSETNLRSHLLSVR